MFELYQSDNTYAGQFRTLERVIESIMDQKWSGSFLVITPNKESRLLYFTPLIARLHIFNPVMNLTEEDRLIVKQEQNTVLPLLDRVEAALSSALDYAGSEGTWHLSNEESVLEELREFLRKKT